MKVFLSGEVHKDVDKSFRRTVSVIEKAMARALGKRDYSIKQFLFFAILTPPEFAWASQERVKFSKKTGVADCHLILDFEAFKSGDSQSQLALFCDGVVRALARLPAAGASTEDCAALTVAFRDLATSKGWILGAPASARCPAIAKKTAPSRARKVKPRRA